MCQLCNGTRVVSENEGFGITFSCCPVCGPESDEESRASVGEIGGRITYKQGDWIIEIAYGLLGTVSNVWPDGVTAKFGGMTAVRGNESIALAPLDIQREDIASMIDLALQTGDREWFRELSERMGVEVGG